MEWRRAYNLRISSSGEGPLRSGLVLTADPSRRSASSGLTHRQTTVDGGRSSADRPGTVIQPPPGARTWSGAVQSSSVSSRSNCLKPDSPRSAKSRDTLSPVRLSISSSKSRNGRPHSAASKRPTVVLPAPGSPTSIRCSLTEPLSGVCEISVQVPLQLSHGIAAELLEHRSRKYDRSHRLGNHTHRGHGGHVTPLGNGRGRFTGGYVHCFERAHESTDRLHGNAHHQRPAGRHPALQSAGVIAASGDTARTALACLPGDLAVHGRAWPAGSLESEADLHALYRMNGHHGTGQPAVELPVPGHVRAEPEWKSANHYFAHAAQRVACALRGINEFDHARLRFGVQRTQRRCIGGSVEILRQFVRHSRVYPAKVHQVAADAHAKLGEQHPADGAGCHTRCRFAGRRALENVASVLTVVLEHPHQVCMARPRASDRTPSRRRITLT